MLDSYKCSKNENVTNFVSCRLILLEVKTNDNLTNEMYFEIVLIDVHFTF